MHDSNGFWITEAIRCKTEECTVQSVLNCIALYSEWYDIGINLGLPIAELDKISQQHHDLDPVSHLVELWHRWDPNGLSWEKLYWALKKISEARAGRIRASSSSSENAQQHWPLCSQQSLPMTPEQLVPDPSIGMEIEPVTGVVKACW